jgi:hypothetical protein
MTVNFVINENTIKALDDQYFRVDSGTLNSIAASNEGDFAKDKDFWHSIINLFKAGTTLKKCGVTFRTLFKKYMHPKLPRKIYMSREE